MRLVIINVSSATDKAVILTLESYLSYSLLSSFKLTWTTSKNI